MLAGGIPTLAGLWILAIPNKVTEFFRKKKQTSTISKIRTLLENYLDNIDILY